jgi:ribosomal protein S18 acetylase RimI-like enzyme
MGVTVVGCKCKNFIYFLCAVKSTFVVRPAIEADCTAVMALIHELAVYEKAAGEVLVTANELREHAFGEKPFVEIIVAAADDEIYGAALFYEKYSTWKGPAIHLEDLIVAENHRGAGIGAALLDEVLRIGNERNYRRVYWQVLDWNTPALRFYERYNARFDAEWVNVYVELDKQNKQ